MANGVVVVTSHPDSLASYLSCIFWTGEDRISLHLVTRCGQALASTAGGHMNLSQSNGFHDLFFKKGRFLHIDIFRKGCDTNLMLVHIDGMPLGLSANGNKLKQIQPPSVGTVSQMFLPT